MLALAEQVKFNWPAFLLTRDTTHLNWWQRFLFWKVYLPFARKCYEWGLPTIIGPDGARIELLSINTSEPVAAAVVAASGRAGDVAFYKRGPVDVSLGTANVIFGGDKIPASDVSEMYKRVGKREVPVICPYSQNLCRPHDAIGRGAINEVVRNSNKMIESVRSLKAQSK